MWCRYSDTPFRSGGSVMDRMDQPPLTKPSLHYFRPYRQTIIGFLIVAAMVGLLIVSTQLLLRAQ